MLSLRCSSAPLAMKCPASTVPPTIRIENAGEAADVGTATHAVLAGWIADGLPTADDIAVVAADKGVDADELSMLSWMGWKCWEKLRAYFPDPQLERQSTLTADGIELTGHADVFSVEHPQVRILDWKTGRLSTDHSDQLRGYALLGLTVYPDCESAYAVVVNIREQRIDGFTWTRAELELWWQKLVDALNAKDAYNPGGHCAYCKRGHECEAKDAYLAQGARMIGAGQNRLMPTKPLLRAILLAELLERASVIEKQAKFTKELIKAEVIASGGVLSLGDGTEHAIKEEARRKMEWTKNAEQITRGVLTADAIRDCLTPSLTDLRKAAMATAPRGQKGAFADDFIEKLNQAGCITTTHTESVERRPVTIED